MIQLRPFHDTIMNNELNQRQETILKMVEKRGSIAVREVVDYFSNRSRLTISRDMAFLVEKGLLTRKGAGRSTVYSLSSAYNAVKPVDVNRYFLKAMENRGAKKTFNFGIFDLITEIFNHSEDRVIKKITQNYQKNIKKLPPETLQKEFERLTIDFSWKSSEIEGNTYTLIETEALILQQQLAKGHDKDEAQMILNHKAALSHIQKNQSDFIEVSAQKIELIHALLVKKLKVKKNLRKTSVGITGTIYRPLDNQYQIREAVEELCKKVNREKTPHAKAFLLNLLIVYIQPFTDGNKRTSRMLGNAILLAHQCCPLSYRSVDVTEYKKAVLLFYEQNNFSHFKELFLEQVEFAAGEYFRV